MRKLAVVLAAALLLIVCGTNAAFAQAGTSTVTGKVVRWTGDPVAGATVRALSGWLETDQELARTTTGADGSYTLSVPAGQTVWVHVDTLGTWWGYSYKPSFNLRPAETISQVYFALGPRDVKVITLPAPVSNVAPETGQNAPPPVVPPVAPPAAPPAAAPVEKPISNVKPEVGYNDQASVPKTVPRTQVQPAPRVLPATGANETATLWLALAGALALAASGLTIRRLAFRR